MNRAIGIAAAVWIWTLVPSVGFAQTTLRGPKEVVISVHQDVENTDFVEPLVCALSRVLIAPVRSQRSSMPIDIGLMSPTGELDARKVIVRFSNELPTDLQVFNFLIIPYDLRSDDLRHTFGTIFGLPYNNGVVSMAFLAPVSPTVPRPEATRIVMLRAYKVILRYIAHASGLWQHAGCVLAFPHGVPALDAKPADFCDDDKALLIEAGVLKAQPGGACSPVAWGSSGEPKSAL